MPNILNIPIPKNGNVKECSNYCTIALISHVSKVMLKIIQARLKQYINCELPDVQMDLVKAEEPEIKLPTSIGSQKEQENSRKPSTSALLTMPKPLTVWITTNCGKFLRDGTTRPPDLSPEKSVCRSRHNNQNWTWNNRLVPNWERSTSRLYTVTLLI